ncbi:hypothetical protein N4R57_01275 [Rhodobacteraceae bacterium D3-12]|nr:hypothetical protein N4R57_01275 [Rhodobacteraceae bacterium D3-12]
MFKRFTDGAFLLGLILGFGITLLFFLTLEVTSPVKNPPPSEVSHCATGTNECAHDDNSVPDWWYWPRRLFSLEDTLAQWIMMVFTVAAAGLLVGTLYQSNKAINIAFGAERPWLKVSAAPDGGLVWDESRVFLTIRINFENVGRSPATIFAISHAAAVGDNFEKIDEIAAAQAISITRNTSQSFMESTVFPGDGGHYGFHADFYYPPGEGRCKWIVTIGYLDEITKAKHWVQIRFSFTTGGGPFIFSDREVRLDKDQWNLDGGWRVYTGSEGGRK